MKLLQLQKRMMALAGTVMTVYLIFHMLTNLTFFSSSTFENFYDVYNQAWIRWPILLLVLVSLVIHIKAAVNIRIKNHQARQIGYKKHDKIHVPAQLVTLSIALLLVFILVHIGQSLLLDTASIRAEVIGWFSSVWMLLFYFAGVGILGMHLQHSLINVLQTLGISAKTHKICIIGGVAVLTIGFASVPAYIWMTA